MQTENPAELPNLLYYFVCNGLIKHTMIEERDVENLSGISKS